MLNIVQNCNILIGLFQLLGNFVMFHKTQKAVSFEKSKSSIKKTSAFN